MIKRKQKGFVIELMIVFMLITFIFCMVITTYLGTLKIERNYAKETVDLQTDLNQIGEYYLRYIEESGAQFPTGTETSFADKKYSWMDDEAKEFFSDCQKYGFKYETAFSITRGGVTDFFSAKFIWRKLIIKSHDDKIKMIIELKEKRVSDSETEYFVQNWTVGDDLVDESADGGYQKDELTILQKLWIFLGLEINSFEDLLKNGDWLKFFVDTFTNFIEVMTNAV